MPCSSLAVQRGDLGLLRTSRLDSSRRGRRGCGFQLLVFRLLGETKLAQPRRLERHRLVLALMVELEGRFPLLRLAQKRLGIAPCGGAACRSLAHVKSPLMRVGALALRGCGRDTLDAGEAPATGPLAPLGRCGCLAPRRLAKGCGRQTGEKMLPNRHSRVHQSLDRLEIWPLAVIAE